MDNSGRKSPDGNKSFKSSTTKSTAEDKTENIKSNLEQNKNRSRSSKNKNKNFKKIDELKSAGASFISQYFKGFSTLERANIKADLDDDIPYRLIDVYQSSILSFCEWKSFSQAMDMGTKLDQQLFGAISLGMAIKLHQSSTDTEKKSNKLLSSLETKIILPKKLGVLIDQMGKSDIPGDNHFRIRNQNYAAKRHLARGIYNLIPKDKLTDYMEDNDYGTKFNDLVLIMEDPLIFPNMVDNSTWSHERIKQLGRSMYNKATSENFVFWKDKNEKDKNNVDPEDQFFMRFPKVDFDTLNLDAIGKILNNLVFTTFGYDTKTMTEMAAGLVLSIAKMAWIKQPTKKMEVLDSKFNGTWFEGKTFINVLAYCGIWNINYYLDDITLNNLALEAIRSWNTGYAKIFNSFLEMNEIPFGEHGSDAQLIQVDRSKLSKFKGIFDYNTRNFVKKAEATTVLKTNENNSLLGLMVGYTKNLSFESDWQLEFSSTNKGILYEFLKNDFKNNY